MNPITTIRLQSLSSADQSQVPFTFGQVFKAGDLMPTDGLAADKLPLQVDVKATHADGSVRHAILSAVLPKLKTGETVSLPLTKAAKQSGSFSMAGLTLPDAKVNLTIDGRVYTASLQDQGLSGLTPWLAGPVVVEGFAWAPLKNAQGAVHPVLKVRFGVRYHLDTKQARVEAVVENCNTWLPGYKFTYDVEFTVAGKAAYVARGLTHYHHSRWHQYAWTGNAPQVHIMHDTAYLIETHAVPNYDQSIIIPESELDDWVNKIGQSNTGPMKIGPVLSDMGSTGGRGDIAPLPVWAVDYLLSMDKRAKDAMMAAADGSGSWSIHYRDEKTSNPLRTDNEVNQHITTHLNAGDRGPLPVPRVANNDWSMFDTPYTADTAHQPSFVYLPYLVSGDYYYLEELQFWASFNPLETVPEWAGLGKGLFRWQQVRGQGWSLRTLGHAAYITPDDNPLKDYFLKQLDANLDFYNSTYVVGNPNNLGIYDGSGENAFQINELKGWMDDYLTWSFGCLVELGFEKARPILQWKAKFPIGRMTAPGFCWVQGAMYVMQFRSPDGRIVPSFDALYKLNFNNAALMNDSDERIAGSEPVDFLSLKCGSKEQADFLARINKRAEWKPGRMSGFSDSGTGYGASMQIALAVAADSGAENAAKAWGVFDSRLDKPDYRYSPQLAIVPRTVSHVPAAASVPASSAPAQSAPSKALALGQKPADGLVGEWSKVGDENGAIKVDIGTYVRYGVPGKAYRYAQVKGEFTATNDAFGGDPVPQVVKVVEAFRVSPPKQPGKLKLGSNKKLAKLDVTVTVFDPFALKEVKVLSQKMDSSGKATLSDSTFTIGQMYGVRVADQKGNLLDTKLPILKAVK